VPFSAVFGLNEEDVAPSLSAGTPRETPPLIGFTLANLRFLFFKRISVVAYFAEMIFPLALKSNS
jgi:hypothetical protein